MMGSFIMEEDYLVCRAYLGAGGVDKEYFVGWLFLHTYIYIAGVLQGHISLAVTQKSREEN